MRSTWNGIDGSEELKTNWGKKIKCLQERGEISAIVLQGFDREINTIGTGNLKKQNQTHKYEYYLSKDQCVGDIEKSL